MQVLKEDVKNKIVEAAVEEFLVNGFENSSLRTIASQAGITIGNIYSYFSSKDDLFNYVVAPAAEALDKFLSFDFVKYDEASEQDLTEISKMICDVFLSNKQRFFILMNGTNSSKSSIFKDIIVELIAKRLMSELFPNLKKKIMDPLFAKVLADSLLAGFLNIFNHYGGDEERLLSLVEDLLGIFLGDIFRKN